MPEDTATVKDVDDVAETDGDLLDVEERVAERIREKERERRRRGTLDTGIITDVHLVESSCDWRDEALEIEFRAPDGTHWRTREYALPERRDGSRPIHRILRHTGASATRIADLVGEEVPVAYAGSSWCLNPPKRSGRLHRAVRRLHARGLLTFHGTNFHPHMGVVVGSFGVALGVGLVAALLHSDVLADATVALAFGLTLIFLSVQWGLTPELKWARQVDEGAE